MKTATPDIHGDMNDLTPARTPYGIASATLGIANADTEVVSLKQHGGRVLANVIVKPVFWGSQWFAPITPSAGQILWAIRSIFLGPFMSALAQYGVGNGRLDPNPVFTGFSGDPPQNFEPSSIEGMLVALLNSGQLPDPSANPTLLACVFTPPDIMASDNDWNGYHTSFSYGASLTIRMGG